MCVLGYVFIITEDEGTRTTTISVDTSGVVLVGDLNLCNPQTASQPLPPQGVGVVTLVTLCLERLTSQVGWYYFY